LNILLLFRKIQKRSKFIDFLNFETTQTILANTFLFYYYALNLSFENVKTAGRLKCCDMEDRKVMAHGAGRQKSEYVAWKGKMLWLMNACLHPPHRTNQS